MGQSVSTKHSHRRQRDTSKTPVSQKDTFISSVHHPQSESSASSSVATVYELKKHHAGCTGMFWRSDPTGQTRLTSNNNWPRDGARLKGHVIVHKNQQWLLVDQVQQRGGTNSNHWRKAPVGAALPFDYHRHYYLEKVL